MAELLLELFSEEIPARMQEEARKELSARLALMYQKTGILSKPTNTYCTPRRLTAHATQLSKTLPDINEERRGPKVDAPEQAIAGFCRSVGLKPSDLIEKDGYYYTRIEQKGAATVDVLAKALPDLIKNFTWPKSMRWGSGTMRWVRPLHSILCIFDGQVIPFEVDGITTGNFTFGHRFLSPGKIIVSSFTDYERKLKEAFVDLRPIEREGRIQYGARKVADSVKGDPQHDEKLLQEVTSLVEWPVVLLGSFDKAFLDIPEEALISAMQHHQKYFPVRNKKSGKLSNHFIFVSNTPGIEGGRAIIEGNERVLSARLADAKFFWDRDRKIPLKENVSNLEGIVFHEKLGSVRWHVSRIQALARILSDKYIPQGNRKLANQAAELCKADLVSGMVGEFPELQGIMEAYYAENQGFDSAVVEAIRSHYSPRGPGDACPAEPVSVAVALADKIATVVFLFYAGERPTGSKDPFALRRAGLGLIRLIVENNLRIPLKDLTKAIKQMAIELDDLDENQTEQVVQDVLDFLIDRLKVQQKEKGVRHDLIDAVFSVGGEDDLVRLLARVKALQDFLKTKDGEVLLYSYKRAVNIVKIEEKKDKKSHAGAVNAKLLKEKEELALHQGMEAARVTIAKALKAEKFADAMAAVAALRKPIDLFFDKVTVNAKDADLRENRLKLLSGIRAALMPVADFSKIEG